MDQIVYCVWSLGGGVDGLDQSDKPRIVAASFHKDEMQKYCGRWNESQPRAQVLNISEARRRALSKLDPIDLLVLGLN